MKKEQPILFIGSLILLFLLIACALKPSTFFTPTPTPDPFFHYRAILQPWASYDIEAVEPLPRYHITTRLNTEETALDGVMKVTIPTPDEEIVFRLYPNMETYIGASMEIMAAKINNDPTPFEMIASGTAIRFSLPTSSDGIQFNPITIELTYRVTLGGHIDAAISDFTLFGWDGQILSLPGFYPTLAVQQHGEWVLDQPVQHGDVLFNEVALYQLDITLPIDMVVVASGVTLNVIDNPDKSRTWQIVGGPLRDMTVIAGPFQALSQQAAGTVVTAYYLPGHDTAAQEVLTHATASLQFYSEFYGPYPYTELDVVEAPLNSRGMEYSGLVLIGESLYENQRDFLTYLVAHEVAHQWWYSIIGNNPYQHPWLDEGLTEYSAFQYYQEAFGPEEAQEMLIGRWWYLSFEEAANGEIEGQIDQPAINFDPATYQLLVYTKAALFFHALREKLGDEMYQTVLRTYYVENRHRITTPQTFLTTAERVSGQDLNPFAESWLK